MRKTKLLFVNNLIDNNHDSKYTPLDLREEYHF